MNFINLYLKNKESQNIVNIKESNVRMLDKIGIAPFYNIDAKLKTDTFNVIISSVTHEVKLTNGVYEYLGDVVNEIKIKLQIIDSNFDCSYNNLTKKITITNTTDFQLDFTKSNAYLLTGFESLQYPPSASMSGENMMNLRPYSLFLINIDGFGFNKKNNFQSRNYTHAVFITNKYYAQPITEYYSFDNSKSEFESEISKNIPNEDTYTNITLNIYIALNNNKIYEYTNSNINFVRLGYKN